MSTKGPTGPPKLGACDDPWCPHCRASARPRRLIGTFTSVTGGTAAGRLTFARPQRSTGVGGARQAQGAPEEGGDIGLDMWWTGSATPTDECDQEALTVESPLALREDLYGRRDPKICRLNLGFCGEPGISTDLVADVPVTFDHPTWMYGRLLEELIPQLAEQRAIVGAMCATHVTNDGPELPGLYFQTDYPVPSLLERWYSLIAVLSVRQGLAHVNVIAGLLLHETAHDGQSAH
jgi:hypothetical protein